VIGNGILTHIPNVIVLAVLVVITRYVFKLMQLFFSGVEKGTITISGFYPEWAQQTCRLARFVVLAFVAVIAFPYIPGSDTPAFRGISIFVGVLFSLGSQSAIANVIAGVALTYRRSSNWETG
jgi:small-conductance mechanosensitive channel